MMEIAVSKDKHNYVWTKNGARLQNLSNGIGKNWLFIPAPGLGSESLIELITLLQGQIPGVFWALDHPNDGSNIDKNINFANWQQALIEATTMLDRPILVGHSTGAKLIQNVPELEALASGFVFMDTAPDMSWRDKFDIYMQQNSTQTIIDCANEYTANPGNETLRSLLISSVKFCFMPEALEAGVEMMKRLPVNYMVANWSDRYFDPIYKAKFIPQLIPTLIIAGEYDQITPLIIYKEKLEYYRDNILIQSISNAGHYPWFENPKDILRVFLKLLNMPIKCWQFFISFDNFLHQWMTYHVHFIEMMKMNSTNFM